MKHLTMPQAGFLAGTTKNPIIRAIKLGEIDAEKDGLGHWQIDEISFFKWLSRREVIGRSPNKSLARNNDVRCGRNAANSSGYMEPVLTAVLEVLRNLDVMEMQVWEHILMQKSLTCTEQLSIISSIIEQKQALHAMRVSLHR